MLADVGASATAPDHTPPVLLLPNLTSSSVVLSPPWAVAAAATCPPGAIWPWLCHSLCWAGAGLEGDSREEAMTVGVLAPEMALRGLCCCCSCCCCRCCPLEDCPYPLLLITPGCFHGEPDRKDILLQCCLVLLYCSFSGFLSCPFLSLTSFSLSFFVVLVLPCPCLQFFLMSPSLFFLQKVSLYSCPGGKNVLSVQSVMSLESRGSNVSFLYVMDQS